MRMAEADNRLVPVLITGAILVGFFLIDTIHIVRNRIGIRTQLHPAEGRTGSGKRVPHAIGPDNGIDIIHRLLACGRQAEHRHCHGDDFFFDIHYVYVLILMKRPRS